MFARFMPQEGKFFELFNAHAELIVQGGRELAALVSELGESPDETAQRAKAINEIEKKADRITHETIAAAAQDLHHAAGPGRDPQPDHLAWTTSST